MKICCSLYVVYVLIDQLIQMTEGKGCGDVRVENLILPLMVGEGWA